MRWVVSLVLLLLVLPLALALDISFNNETEEFYHINPVNISFSTDKLSDCTYSLRQYFHKPDFSCSPYSCTYISCQYDCIDSKDSILLKEGISLPKNNDQFLISLSPSYGNYDLELQCKHTEREQSSKVISFLYGKTPFQLQWSLLTREHFATTQESNFYAYFFSTKVIDSIALSISGSGITNTTIIDGPIYAKEGYLFSYNLKKLPQGTYDLKVIFYYGENEYDLSKEFTVTSVESLKVSSLSNSSYDIEFIDPLSKITSFYESNISHKKIVIPSSRLDAHVKSDDVFSVEFQNLDLTKNDFSIYSNKEYVLKSDLIGENKPLKELASYVFYTDLTPDYISKVIFNYSSLGVIDPQKLRIFKAKATSINDVDLTSGEFYTIDGLQTPLYVDEINKLAYIYVKDFSLFSLIEETQIGQPITRNATTSYITLRMINITLEGIERDIWSLIYKEKEYKFLINTIDGAKAYFEFSPKGEIITSHVNDIILRDLDDDGNNDMSIYIKAITPSKIIFSTLLLEQPPKPDSFLQMISKRILSLLFSYVFLALIILFFGIRWFLFHALEKPEELSQEVIDHIEKENKHIYPLLNYVQKLKKRGMEKKYIRTHLLSVGWPKDVIDELMENEAVFEKETISLFNSPHINSPRIKKITSDSLLNLKEESLLNYIIKEYTKGIDREKIQSELLQAGWDAPLINKIFTMVK